MHYIAAMRIRGGFGSCVVWAALSAVACGGADGAKTGDDEVRSSERGFEYTCAVPPGSTLLDKPTTTVLITEGHLRFDGDYGPNLGDRDPRYKAPRGTTRVRYEGFETGDDCALKAVADAALVRGDARGELRLQCAGDDFQQDVLSCSHPKPATFKVPIAPPPPPEPPLPPADAKSFACTTTADYPLLEATLTMQVVDGSIRLRGEDGETTATRDRDYRPRSGDWIAYDDVGYGGDCSMSLVVEGRALAAETSETVLKVRCAGDEFQEDRYACKAR